MSGITPHRPIQHLSFTPPGRYVHQDYPAARYHEDGRCVRVENAEEDAIKCPESEGWSKKPFPSKPSAPAPAAPKADELKAAHDKLAESLKSLQENHSKLLVQHEALKDAHTALSAEHTALAAAHTEKITENMDLRAQLAATTEGRDAALQQLADAAKADPEKKPAKAK